MCIPVSVITGGAYSCPVGANHGLLVGQIVALVGLVGGLGWNLKGFIRRSFSSKST